MNESPEKAEELAETDAHGGAENSRSVVTNSSTSLSKEVLACPKCARNNHQSRVRCLYCGAILFALSDVKQDAPDATSGALKEEALRSIVANASSEAAEQFYLVLTKRADERWTEDHLTRAAQLAGKRDAAWTSNRLNLIAPSPQSVADISNSQTANAHDTTSRPEINRQSETVGDVLPLLRVASSLEARVWRERFASNALTVEIFSDGDLQTEIAPQILRRASLEEDRFVGFTSAGTGGTSVKFRLREIALIVAGRIYSKQFAVREQHAGRKKSESAALDTHETSSDDQVIDIYTFHEPEAATHSSGWRIHAKSFDFGCLGARKSLLAAENFRTLIRRLCEAAPQARFDDTYWRVRRLLADALPLDEQASGGGMKRAQFGRTVSESVIETGNETQFTLYGRMLRQHYAAGENVSGRAEHEANG